MSQLEKNRITLHRLYKDAPTDRNGEQLASIKHMNNIADSVIFAASKYSSIPAYTLTMDSEWIIDVENQEIVLDKERDIAVTVKQINRRTVSEISNVVLEVSSEKLNAQELKAYVEELHKEYQESMCTQLTGTPCVFDQKFNSDGSMDFRGSPYDDPVQTKRFLISQAPKHLSFVKNRFLSNKTFQNLVGPEVKSVYERVKFFLNNKSWYDKKGIPYRLTLMLSGESGAGKSSCIKAIANLTKRHIVNVKFSTIKTVTQLRKLFQSDELHIYEDEDKRDVVKLNVPSVQRIFVLEEIDATGDSPVLMDRRLGGAKEASIEDELTLGDILQVLDGTIEAPGRIVIMTSNYPERLDKALMRPGRVDLAIKFGLATNTSIAELYEKLTENTLSNDQINGIPDQKISVADATEIIFRNFNTTVDSFVDDLCEYAKKRGLDEEKKQREAEDIANSNVTKSTPVKKMMQMQQGKQSNYW